MPQALTLTADGLARELKCPVLVGVPGDIQVTKLLTAVWDTGATGSVITQAVVDELGIEPIAMTRVHGVAGVMMSPIYLVNILLPMEVGIPMLRVTLADLPTGTDVLLGMDVITHGDFVISNKAGKTIMSFRVPSSGDWDFVEDIEAARTTGAPNRATRRAQEKQARRNPR